MRAMFAAANFAFALTLLALDVRGGALVIAFMWSVVGFVDGFTTAAREGR